MFRRILREGEAEPFFDVVSSLARAVARWPGAVDTLSEGFSHPDVDRRRHVVLIFQEIGPACLGVWDRLVAVLSDDDRRVRGGALRAVLRADPAAAVAEPAVSRLLEDPEFRIAVAVTLMQIPAGAAALVADIPKRAAALGRVGAIKWLRGYSGCGLSEAKSLVDTALAQSAGPAETQRLPRTDGESRPE